MVPYLSQGLESQCRHYRSSGSTDVGGAQLAGKEAGHLSKPKTFLATEITSIFFSSSPTPGKWRESVTGTHYDPQTATPPLRKNSHSSSCPIQHYLYLLLSYLSSLASAHCSFALWGLALLSTMLSTIMAPYHFFCPRLSCEGTSPRMIVCLSKTREHLRLPQKKSDHWSIKVSNV